MPIIKQRPVTPQEKQQIINLFLRNPDEDAIARQFKISKNTVAVITRKYFQSKPAFAYLD